MKVPVRGKPFAVKIEDQFNKELLSLLKANRVSQAFYDDVHSTGGTPPRLYGLAKVHKPETPLRPVLSLPGSCYATLKHYANIETSIAEMKKILCEDQIEEDNVVFSMDVKSLYTNVPVLEAINIAAGKAYNLEEKPPMDKSTFMQLMRLAVTDIEFLACG
ncbi:uncharacterized protein LOC134854721 [Symsagittifera roscoffensis]|uniref:uncharacterized protein LOC134854721 n=1 Tax=Symsagittifera roscoffensis TaxID=84072 RepID=UPI00307B2B58